MYRFFGAHAADFGCRYKDEGLSGVNYFKHF
jgi:hypothetical protein